MTTTKYSARRAFGGALNWMPMFKNQISQNTVDDRFKYTYIAAFPRKKLQIFPENPLTNPFRFVKSPQSLSQVEL
ncbi:MAG: hypothetical protein WCO97_08615 [bacterium]